MNIPVDLSPNATKKLFFASLSKSVANENIVIQIRDDQGNVIPSRVTVEPDGTIMFDQIQGDRMSSVLIS